MTTLTAPRTEALAGVGVRPAYMLSIVSDLTKTATFHGPYPAPLPEEAVASMLEWYQTTLFGNGWTFDQIENAVYAVTEHPILPLPA